MHISVPKEHTIEYITQTQLSPLVSKGVAKVCYIGDNRNGTHITEEAAMEMGRNLPGSPVVGYYREDLQDFEEHSRDIQITEDSFEIIDLTKPYGFVPTDSKIWLQSFVDDGVEHQYLCCEVILWTSAYPEAKKVFDSTGNNQSMELFKESIKGQWANSENSASRIFIINEALIEKLCILGEDFEPCFEGASVQANFSLQLKDEIEQLKSSMYSLIQEMQNTLTKGGESMSTQVESEVEVAQAEIEYSAPVSVENEYAALQDKYSQLETQYQQLKDEYAKMQEEVAELRAYKTESEKGKKLAKLDEFSMVPEAVRQEIMDGIDKYSVEQIESELAVYCYRNKINFIQEQVESEEVEEIPMGVTGIASNYSFIQNEVDSAPEWVKAVRNIQEEEV